ncbi:hypothetical protein [Burkholderia pseudomallei]|uniref:hypothetical protein n=1 Tax=Burkholderia pseudomallei TaxID=28450 RepID=UPI001F4CCE58|nr:hypothetical protein [Burkholderia pseudomallei]MCW0142021.1 hypothetical protein [Burkholderia pseudomallei]
MSMKEGGEFDRRSIVLMKMIFKYRNFNRCFFGNDSDGIENKMGMIFAIFIRRRPGSAGFFGGWMKRLRCNFVRPERRSARPERGWRRSAPKRAERR